MIEGHIRKRSRQQRIHDLISVTLPRSQFRMKRAFYEWGAMTNLAMAILCFGYWAVSVATPRIDFEVFLPLGHWSSTQVLASGGTLTINDHRGSKEEIEDVSRFRVINPPLTSKLRRVLPG